MFVRTIALTVRINRVNLFQMSKHANQMHLIESRAPKFSIRFDLSFRRK